MDDKSSNVSVDGESTFNEEMLLTYISLDEYIKKCNFDEVQLKMIKMIEHGYTYDEIATTLKILPSTIKGRLKTIFKKVVRENDRAWRKAVYVNKLGLKTKRCSKCEEELPVVEEFYSDNKDSKDSFHSQCKKCRS